jgi:hypothetical protein
MNSKSYRQLLRFVQQTNQIILHSNLVPSPVDTTPAGLESIDDTFASENGQKKMARIVITPPAVITNDNEYGVIASLPHTSSKEPVTVMPDRGWGECLSPLNEDKLAFTTMEMDPVRPLNDDKLAFTTMKMDPVRPFEGDDMESMPLSQLASLDEYSNSPRPLMHTKLSLFSSEKGTNESHNLFSKLDETSVTYNNNISESLFSKVGENTGGSDTKKQIEYATFGTEPISLKQGVIEKEVTKITSSPTVQKAKSNIDIRFEGHLDESSSSSSDDNPIVRPREAIPSLFIPNHHSRNRVLASTTSNSVQDSKLRQMKQDFRKEKSAEKTVSFFKKATPNRPALEPPRRNTTSDNGFMQLLADFDNSKMGSVSMSTRPKAYNEPRQIKILNSGNSSRSTFIEPKRNLTHTSMETSTPRAARQPWCAPNTNKLFDVVYATDPKHAAADTIPKSQLIRVPDSFQSIEHYLDGIVDDCGLISYFDKRILC